jgi:hypothetical protein
MRTSDQRLTQVEARRNRSVTAMIDGYRSAIDNLVVRAQARTLADLQGQVDIKDGRIQPTVRTQNAMRRVDQLFMGAMEESGLSRVLNGFTSSFASQIPIFRESLAIVGQREKIPLEDFQFRSEDQRSLLANQTNAQTLLRTAVEQGAQAGRQNAMLSVGGVPFRDLAEGLANRFRLAVSKSEDIAKTAISTYYRLLTAASSTRIEAGLPPGIVLRFQPIGPRDKLNRPFCRKLLDLGRTYTREQIEGMNNGQGLPVFTTFGGYKCRHVWGIDSLDQQS